MFLATKFYAPRPRPGTVPRPALVARLEEGAQGGLTVLAAPAGSGKTTLLGEWRVASGDRRAFAWVSLEPADNDPVRFWAAIVHALRTVEPGFGDRVLAVLSAPGTGLLDVVVPRLVAELTGLDRSIVLVLDDYHVLESQDVHRSVGFLVDQRPESLHLVLASRTDPPLALGRLRGSGQMTELRMEQLRFGAEEADLLLNGTMGIGLGPADVRRLAQRTEGWPAGIYLAGLSLRGRPDAAQAARAFAGDDRHVVDYLAAEMLDRQPEAVREFMLRTSALDRLCGPLCDAVCETTGSASLLQEMERWNLFLVPLDRRREWFRYHALFAGLLRYELEREDAGVVPDLHRRAAAWHRDHGDAADAIHHALEGGDSGQAGELVAAHWNGTLQSGQVQTVQAWLDRLPAGMVASDPRLCIARAWSFVFTGRLDEVERWTALAERGRRPGPFHIGTSLESAVAVLRAACSHLLGDAGPMLEAARDAVRLEPETAPPRGIALLLLGHAQARLGHLDEAHGTFCAALALAPQAGPTAAMSALAHLAAIDMDRGDVEDARERCERALELADQHDAGERWIAAWPLIVRARLHERDGLLAEARADLERAAALARRGNARLERAESLIRLAVVQRAQRDRHAADQTLREAQRTVAACPDPGTLAGLLAGATAGGAQRPGVVVEPGDELSEREIAVLRMLPGPLSNRDIGNELFISLNTVKTHLRRIYQKLEAADRRDAVRRARELGLL